jgi:hypothetical protein
MADAFEVVEKAWEDTGARRAAAVAFVKQMQSADTPEKKRAVGELRTDPFYDAIFKFKTYYELKSKEGSLNTAQMSELKSIEGWSSKLATAWSTGKVKTMLYDLYKQLKSEGIGSRETAMVIADLEQKNPDFRRRLQEGKGRRRTGRGRRARGRRRHTKRR